MARSDTFPGTIDRPGTSWRWRVGVDGERYTLTLPRDGDEDMPAEPDREDVEAFARRKYDALKDAPACRQRMSDLLDRFERDHIPTLATTTAIGYRSSVKAVRQHFVVDGNNPEVRHVDTPAVQSFLDWRRTHATNGRELDDPLAAKTMEQERAILHKIFSRARSWGMCATNPVSDTDTYDPDERDPVILSDEQYDALLDECENHGPFLHLYALVLGEAGLRCNSEALWLRWDDVDLDTTERDPATGETHVIGILRVVQGRDGHRVKGGKGRDVPMTPRLRDAMRDHFARFRFATYDGERTPWIFHHRHRIRGRDAGDRIKSFKRGFFDAAERADLPDRLWQHDLRHRRVTTWLAAGKSPVKVQKAMGHADLETTMRYYRFVRGHLASLVDAGDGKSAELRHLLRQLIDAIENGDGEAVAGLVS